MCRRTGNLIAVLLGITVAASAAHATTGWYVSFGAGASQASTMKQAGSNEDSTCYPDDLCTAEFAPDGYRWRYDLHPDSGAALELAVGYDFRLFRLELATTHQTLGIDQQFVVGRYRDGSGILPNPESFYAVDVETGADDLTLHTVSAGAYLDLPLNNTLMTPYLGIGLGFAFARLSGLRYESSYALREFDCSDFGLETGCQAPPQYEALREVDPAMYNGRQHIDLSDTVPTAHFHLGADYRLTDTLLFGVKASYNLVDSMSRTDAYEFHAIEGMDSHTEISGIRYWTVLLKLRWQFRRDALFEERG